MIRLTRFRAAPFLLGLGFLCGLWTLLGHTIAPNAALKMKLSEYGFFEGSLRDLKPAADVLPYDLNTPLFTDYAWKARFIRLPAATSATYKPSFALDFPIGTVLIKTFYYPADFRKPEGERRILETRLLIREEKGWKALPYIWNEAQTEATLEVAGGRIPIAWIHADGSKKNLEYVVPNMNQCKGCHEMGGQVTPIGPSAAQLNKPFNYGDHTENQLTEWQKRGWLQALPALAEVPRLAAWDDPGSGDLNARARAYLAANCAHCHHPQGPANTSGLFLDPEETNPMRLGVLKAPIAAGRGSGNLQYSIVPAKPDQSILLYRMNSRDAGVMMPELGRKMLHPEGIALIREWIAAMRP